jgi:hypothetical protein
MECAHSSAKLGLELSTSQHQLGMVPHVRYLTVEPYYRMLRTRAMVLKLSREYQVHTAVASVRRSHALGDSIAAPSCLVPR